MTKQEKVVPRWAFVSAWSIAALAVCANLYLANRLVNTTELLSVCVGALIETDNRGTKGKDKVFKRSPNREQI